MRVFSIFILGMVVCCLGHQDLGTAKISNFISETLQLTETQNYWNSLEVSVKYPDGKQLLNNIERKFSKKHNELVAAVERLAKESEDSYEAHWTTPITNLFGQWLGGRQSCCRSNPTQFKSVSEEDVEGCELSSESAPFGATKLKDNFEKACIANMRNGEVQRQYFASVDGVTTVYPKLQESHCETFESSERPWFARSFEQQPRQVVILFDNNPLAFDSMWEWYSQSLNRLRKMAIRQINSLTPYDKVAVLTASGLELESSFCKTCFNSQFVSGTEQNKKELRDFIHSITVTGVPKYVETIEDAFSFLRRESPDSESTYSQELVFFTRSSFHDFLPVDDVKKIIARHDKARKHPVKFIMSNPNGLKIQFRVRPSTDSASNKNEERQFVTTKTLQQPSTETKETVKSTSAWTFPYLDRWRLGQVITISQPVYKNGHVIGVAAVDSSLDSFFDPSSSIVHRDDSVYAFLLDDAGHVISHPLLHRQNEVDLNAVDISSLERDDKFKHVIASIRRGENGEKQLYATRYQQRGSGYEAMSEKILTSYYWKKVPNTKFTIGLVMVAQSHIDLRHHKNVPESSLLFHRFDLLPPEAPCSHYNKYATMKKSSLFLTSRAFLKQKNFHDVLQGTDDVMDFNNYVNDIEKSRLLLKDGVRDEIIATDYIQFLWTRNTYQSNIVWRHFTTTKGVFRIYPGIQIPEWYDPTNREWYHQALARKARGSIITTPYKDPASHLVVVTIAQALYHDSGSMVNPAVGITGQDMRFDYFYKQFLFWYPACTKKQNICHMIDERGFLILTNAANHSNPQLIGLKRTPSVKLHVTQMEPEISRMLIMKQIFQVKICSVMSTGCTRKVFQIKNLAGAYKKNFHFQNKRFQFSLVPVEHSNAYVLIRSLNQNQIKTDDQLFQYVKYFDNGKAFSGENASIYGDSQSDQYCGGSYHSSFINAMPCVPVSVSNDSPMFDIRTTFTLPQCYSTLFTPFTMKSATVFPCMEWMMVGFLIFVLSMLFIQNLNPTNFFRSLSSKLNSKLHWDFDNCVLLDTERVSEFIKDNHVTAVSHNLIASPSEQCSAQQQASRDTNAQHSLIVNTPTELIKGREQSRLLQPGTTIEHSKSDGDQVDLVDDGCNLQAAELSQFDEPQKCSVGNKAPKCLSRLCQIPSEQIAASFEPKREPEDYSSPTLPPRGRHQHQITSTSPASDKHKTSDYYWQLLLQEFPIASDAPEDKLQKLGYSSYADLPALHKMSEDMFQSMFDKLTAEDHRLISFLTPEEEWEFLYFCERPHEWPLSSKSEEELFKQTCEQFCDFV